MSGYMRRIIYLRRIKQGVPASGAGYIRLERKREYLFFSLTMTDGQVPEGSSVYAAYRQDGDWQRLSFGQVENTVSSWKTKRRLTSLPFQGLEDTIEGFFLGTAKEYWAGEISDVDIPYEELWEEMRPADAQPEEIEEAAAVESAPEQQELPGSEMYPFDDDEMQWCRQVEPEDFSSLPTPCWRLGNNSFLFHGYYNYRHLLYAGDGSRRYIGVPGQYHRREQYLARQFGFPRFKGTRKKRVSMGDFGYWLQEVGGDEDDQR